MEAAGSASTARFLRFGDFRFDPRGGILVRDGAELPLRPKTAALLTRLVSRAGEVLSKADLIQGVWGGNAGDDALAVAVAQLRGVLGDDARAPRYVATVHRRGYRFVAPVSGSAPIRRLRFAGRARELSVLRGWWDAAAAGRRRTGFVVGEAGIGKTTLVRAFLEGITDQEFLVGRGQCMDDFGERAPYLPLFDSIGGLAAGPYAQVVREALAEHAPTWLLQLPSLIDERSVPRLRARALGGRADRMLRELADALEAIAAVHPVVLVFEDLQSADRASLDVISYLARRSASTRLLVLGTYRVENGESQPIGTLTGELHARRRADRLELGPLDAAAAAECVALRLAPALPDPDLTSALLRRSEGNPLFLTTMLEDLSARGALVEGDGVVHGPVGDEPIIPGSLRQLVSSRLEAVTADERRLLEVAAVAGAEFGVSAVCAGLAVLAEEEGEPALGELGVEAALTGLARRTSLLEQLEPAAWPDGTFFARFRFGHALYRDLLADALGPARRARLHRAIGERLEAAFGTGTVVVAVELARHFERGRDPVRAVRYLGEAAGVALAGHAPREALMSARRALELLAPMPADAERTRTELGLRMIVLNAVIELEGIGAPSVDEAVADVGVVIARVTDPVEIGVARYALWSVVFMRGDMWRADALLDGIDRAATEALSLAVRLRALNARAATKLATADLAAARLAADEAALIHERGAPHPGDSAIDQRVLIRTWAAYTSWLLGEPDRARAEIGAALRLAAESGDPAHACQAHWPLAALRYLLGDVRLVRPAADELLEVARAHDLRFWEAAATFLVGLALNAEGDPVGGVERMRIGLQAFGGTWAGFSTPAHLGLFGEAQLAAGDPAGALASVEEAVGIAERTGERWYLAELLRLRAEACWALDAGARPPGAEARARATLRDALAIARAQGALPLEARVLASLGRLGVVGAVAE